MVDGVDPVSMLAFATSIGIFGASLALVGKLGNDAIKGAIAMGIAGVALIPAAYAFSLMAGVDPMSVLALSGSLIALGIAAALLPNPKLLMLDEPTNGLDPEGIQEVRALLRDLANDGTTVFVSSHLLSELEIISDHIVMLRKGEIVFAGPIGELMTKQQPTIIAKSLNHSDLSRIAEIAEKSGHHAVIRNDSVHILAPMDWAPILNKAAFDAGITLAQLAPQLPNLEETFFEMTGDK